VTLAASSSDAKDLRDKLSHGGNIDAAKVVGEDIAKKVLTEAVSCSTEEFKRLQTLQEKQVLISNLCFQADFRFKYFIKAPFL